MTRSWVKSLARLLCDPDDLLVGEIAVERGLLTPEHLDDCLREQGKDPRRRLDEILLQRNLLSPEHFSALMREHDTRRLRLPGETQASLPEEVRVALQHGAGCLGSLVKLQQIGSGGTGIVWRCYDLDLRRFVAAKTLNSDNSTLLKRFIREAQIAASLRHPNIVSVHAAGVIHQTHYIVMDLIDGTSIANRTFDVVQATRIIRTIALAAHAAHERGIIHRDIKPGNILFDRKKQPFLADFGLAKDVDLKTSLSQEGTMMGTLAYMPPEQALGSLSKVDRRSDVYGLGATLYELLTGHAPFDSQALLKGTLDICRDAPPPPRRWRPDIPAPLETIVLRAMAKDPGRRYGSALELAQDLERFLEGKPILARPDSLGYRMVRQARRHWLAVGGVACLFIGMGAFLLRVNLIQKADLRRELERGWNLLREGNLQAASEAVAHARAIDRRSVDELSARIQEALALEAERREEERDREEERRTVEPLFHTLWEQDLTDLLGPQDLPTDVRDILTRAQELLHRHPRWSGAWLASGWAKRLLLATRSQSASIAEATMDLDRSVTLAPSWLAHDARYQRGVAYAQRAWVARGSFNWIQTARSEKRSWSMKPPTSQVLEWLNIARADLAEAAKSSTENEMTYPRALLLFLEDKYEDAIQVLKRKKAVTVRERLLLASCYYFGLGDPIFVGDVERIAELTQGRDALELAGQMNHGLGNLSKAEHHYDRLIEIAPHVVEFWNYRGVLRLLQDNDEGALKDFTRSIAVDPECAYGYYGRAMILYRQDKPADAISDYTNAIRRDSQFIVAYFNRAIALRDVQRYDDAIADLTQILKIEPRNANAFNECGLTRDLAGDHARAIEDFNAALQINPKFCEAYTNRGAARQRMNQLREAIADYTHSIDADSNYLDAYVSRAVAQDLRARSEPAKAADLRASALRDLRKTLQVAPLNWPRRKQVVKSIGQLEDMISKD